MLNEKLNFSKTLEKISKVIKENGYSISLILKELNELIIKKFKNKELEGKKFIRIFSEISQLENQVIKSTFGDIYLSSLIAIFKKNWLILILSKKQLSWLH